MRQQIGPPDAHADGIGVLVDRIEILDAAGHEIGVDDELRTRERAPSSRLEILHPGGGTLERETAGTKPRALETNCRFRGVDSLDPPVGSLAYRLEQLCEPGYDTRVPSPGNPALEHDAVRIIAN